MLDIYLKIDDLLNSINCDDIYISPTLCAILKESPIFQVVDDMDFHGIYKNKKIYIKYDINILDMNVYDMDNIIIADLKEVLVLIGLNISNEE